jgi:GNAT superfamily N-acetyltransferase
MDQWKPALPSGYSHVAPGQIANIVTCLEMTAKPPARPVRPLPAGAALQRRGAADLAAYRDLFRRVGEEWMWFSRLVMPEDQLRRILEDERVELYFLVHDGAPTGLLELDFRAEGQCELAFFGLVREAIGQGAGRYLMDQAITRAWARPIRRFWVHTCSFDHPGAVDFYRRSGFRPYAFGVEVADDPRLTGHLPRSAAPHVALIEP